MDSQEFREFARAAIDLLAEYRDNIRERDVLPSVEPGFLVNQFPEEAPAQPEDWRMVLKDVQQCILPGLSHWRSPQFHAFYPAGASYASIVGNLISDGLGVIGFSWMSSPACTELEVVAMNWLGKLMGLPHHFLNCSSGPGGGVIQCTTSVSTLIALLVAKKQTIRRLMKDDPTLDEGEIKNKLVAYASDQSNSSVEKAGIHGSMKMRLLKSDKDGRLRGKELMNAFEADIAKGLIPCYVVATLGTTGTCAFDPLNELGPVCQEASVWLHVDAAYAGAAFVCPEYRHLMRGIEYVDSFVFNPHKWLLVNFDCAAFWLKNAYNLIDTFDVQRIYLDYVKSSTMIPDYRHWQIPLGRGFRSLKLWTVLRIYGREGLRSHIRNQVGLAQHFMKLMLADDRFVVEPEPLLSLVCFRLQGGDNVTKRLLVNLTEKKKVYMVAATHRDRYVIRFAVGAEQTTKEDIEVSWSLIKKEADIVYPEVQYKNVHISAIKKLSIENCFEKMQ